MLSAKGLLSSRPRRGTELQPENQWNLLDPDVLTWLLQRKPSLRLMVEFTQVRLAVEPPAAAMAARALTADHAARITAALERMRAAARGDDDPLESDIAFHTAILTASGNRFFEELGHLVEVALRYSIRVTNKLKGVRSASVAEHAAVAEGIITGDAPAASEAMTLMLADVQLLLSSDNAKSAFNETC